MEIPKDFRGYAGDPNSELEVTFLFGLLYGHLEFPFVVTSINDTFPDCEGIDPETGKTVRIEFETLSRHFLDHKHPVEKCDYIVCWQDNWPDSPVKVISLKELVKKHALEGKSFIDIPSPNSLREQLENTKSMDPQIYETVEHFLKVCIPRLQEQFPEIFIDDTLSKHFNIKLNKKGLVGIYPTNGKLVCPTVREMAKQYGPKIAKETGDFRDIAISQIGMLSSKEDADRLENALSNLVIAMKSSNT